jgi:hypothetical protein
MGTSRCRELGCEVWGGHLLLLLLLLMVRKSLRKLLVVVVWKSFDLEHGIDLFVYFLMEQKLTVSIFLKLEKIINFINA